MDDRLLHTIMFLYLKSKAGCANGETPEGLVRSRLGLLSPLLYEAWPWGLPSSQ